MYSKTFVALATLSMVAAQLTNSVAAVSSAASVLSSLVDAYTGGDLSGALVIQQSYDPLSSAVAALDAAAGSATASDITDSTVSELSGFLSQVTGLLSALESKASTFSGVGAGQIVANDINGLGPDSADIVAKLLSVGAASPDAVASLAPGVTSLSAAFAAAASAYGATNPNIPLPTGGSSESSAPAASSGAVESSAAPASSAAPSHSGNGTYVTTVVTDFTTYCPEPTTFTHGNKTYTVTEATTLTITDCPCTITHASSVAPETSGPAPAPTQTTPPPVNGAAALALGAAPLLAAAVAML